MTDEGETQKRNCLKTAQKKDREFVRKTGTRNERKQKKKSSKQTRLIK